MARRYDERTNHSSDKQMQRKLEDYEDDTEWYRYLKTEGLPSLPYAGMVTTGTYYYIPLKATVHTHPCDLYQNDGVTDIYLSQEDKDTATKFPSLRHYIVGCNVIGSFNQYSIKPLVEQSGSLSQICSVVH